MTRSSAFRSVWVSIVLSLLLLALLPATALADDKTIMVWPDEAAVDGKVKVAGEDYDKDYPEAAAQYGFVFMTVYFSSQAVDVGDCIDVDLQTYAVVDDSCKVDEFGDWLTWFKVPDALPDGDIAGDVEEDNYYIYVTYLNDDVIVAAHMIEVTDVPDEDFIAIPRRYPGSSWWRFPYGWPYDEDGLPWDCFPHPFLWPPDEWPDEWPYRWPYFWPFPPPDECDDGGYEWLTPVPLPPCGC